MNTQEVLGRLDELYAGNDKEKLESFMLGSIDQAEKEENVSVQLAVINELIGFYRNSSRTKESLNWCGRLLTLMKDNDIDGTIHYATSMLNIATAYRAAGMGEEALRSYAEVAAIYSITLDDNDVRIGALCNNICVTCLELGRLDDALEHATRARDILKNVPGAELEAATACSNLAAVYVAMGEDHQEDAISCLNDALDIFKGKNDLGTGYAAALSHLAQIYMRSGDYAKAAENYEDAVAAVERSYGRNVPYVITCRNYALALEKLGEDEKAAEIRKQADEAEAAIK